MGNELNIFCIGIGGSGLSALAALLHEKGNNVSGQDSSASAFTDSLTKNGISVSVGADKQNIPENTDLVIYSAAVPESNPLRLEAQEKGIRLLSYPQAVGELTKQYKTVAVCGTHGKTTTTAMIALLMAHFDDPTVLVGANISELNNKNYCVGKEGGFLILEACEYQRHFLEYNPQIIVLTNVELDHLDYFKDEEDYYSAFKEFIGKLEPNGSLICNLQDTNCENVAATTPNRIDYQPDSSIELSIPGDHNKANASAALAAVKHILNLSDDQLQQAKELLFNFKGTSRRFELIGEKDGTKIYDDYAHHPTAIKATLKAAREKFGPQAKILCIFQPHQYSRTKKLYKDFLSAFADTDSVIIPNIYKVRDSEADAQAVSAEQLAKDLAANHPDSQFGNGLDNTLKTIKPLLPDYDVVITMGAGDISELPQRIISS